MKGLCALALPLLAGAACGPDFERLDLFARTLPPDTTGVTVAFEGVTLPVGVAVGIVATPIDDDGEEMDEDVNVVLRSENPAILGVDPLIDERSFVFYGASAGTTNARVVVDGLEGALIPASVTLQPQ